MGLDLVELVISFEDAFGVPIPDAVASELTTPRQVTDYIFSQLQAGEASACMSQQAFYRLRKEFVLVTGIQRSEFYPAVKLRQLLPVESRVGVWASLRKQMGARALPDLSRPAWLVSLLLLLTILTTIAVFLYLQLASGSLNTAFWSSVLVFGGVGYVAAQLTRPLKRDFNNSYQTAGDLANYLATHSPHTFKKEWTREEVARLVREIIIHETGVENFTDDSRFVQDMHLD